MYKDKMLNYKPSYLPELDMNAGTHRFIYDRKNGSKTAYIHYLDGMEIWEFCPELWHGWRLMYRIDSSEKEIY